MIEFSKNEYWVIFRVQNWRKKEIFFDLAQKFFFIPLVLGLAEKSYLPQ
jgi:hypothetical protein